MSERRRSLLLLVILLLAAVAMPGVAGPPVSVDRGQPIDADRFSLLRGAEPEATAATTPADRELSETARLKAGLRTIRADEVHDRGITGDGVRVGVIGSTFDPSHRAVADSVADHRRLGRATGAESAAHDTAVAEVVAQTAPDSELYLAGIGDSPTPDEYADAIDWLLANDVDIVVDSGSYFPAGDGRTGRITDAAERASDRGVVFVTSAGNYADRHWSTESVDVAEGGGEGWVEFRDGVEANALDGGAATGGRVSLQLSWTGDADYDLFLYRAEGGREPVVAKSVDRQATDPGLANVESIDARVPKGRYYVAIYARETASVGDDGDGAGRVQLFSAYQSLNHTTATGSMVAPATSQDVIAVGAYDSKTGLIRKYSSRGAGTADVDVDAPDGYETDAAGDFRGTSAAAPYVAGTAALMESSGNDLSPARIERILETTARHENGVRQLDTMAAVTAATETGSEVHDGGGLTAVTSENASAAPDAPDVDGSLTLESNATTDWAGVERPPKSGTADTTNATDTPDVADATNATDTTDVAEATVNGSTVASAAPGVDP